MTAMLHALQVTLAAHHAVKPLIGTLFLMASTFVLSRMGDFFIKFKKDVDSARNMRIGMRYFLTVFFLIGMWLIWAAEVMHVFYAAAAVLVALLYIAKELFMCLFGNVVKAYGRLCPVGELVEIGGVKGEVIDAGLLSTSLQVIENGNSHSEKIISIPNAAFLTQPVYHLSFPGEYGLVFVKIPVAVSSNIKEKCERLEAIVEEVSEPYRQDAEAHLGRTMESMLLDLPATITRVALEPIDHDAVMLVARFACPAEMRGPLEQEVYMRFYTSANNVSLPAAKAPINALVETP